MFLKCSVRKKDGKEHRSWSIVESRRIGRTRTIHRHVLYLGELSDSQHRSWQKAIGVFDESTGDEQPMFLFPEDRQPPLDGDIDVLRLRVSALRPERPRQWGACWLADLLWQRLQLDSFFAQLLGRGRKGTDWATVLRILTIYRLLSPGSEWRLHREWFQQTALADLLDVDVCAAQDDTLYRAHDCVLKHREALFAHLRQRWANLFNVRYEVLLYDLTSTYFECDAPDDTNDPRRFGHSRDRHSDCVQVVVALGELKTQLMDRPMSRDDLLEKIGAAKDRAGRQAAALVRVTVAAAKPKAVKTSDQGTSGNRASKGVKKKTAPKQNLDLIGVEALSYHLDKTKLRRVRIREGCYLLRTNMTGGDPDELWRYYMQLVAVEEAFRALKGDLGLRPIFHKKPSRIEAHLFIAFLAYCLSITLRQQLRGIAGGLMPRRCSTRVSPPPMDANFC
jgi:hypothetical protein